MRILFLTHGYPPYDLGGLTLQCQESVDVLRARGHACQVITSRYGVDGSSPSEEGITRSLYFQANVNHYQPLDFFLQRPWQERANRRALRRALDVFQPDVVFVWGLWNLSRALPYWAEKWMSPERVAYAIADYWPMEPDIHEVYWCLPARRPVVERIKALIRPAILRHLQQEQHLHALQFAHAMSCSAYTANKLILEGALPHGARVIYNGIDPKPFICRRHPHHTDGILKLVYFGALSGHKGVDIAIRALGLLRQRDQADGLTLTLVGSGHPDYMAYLRGLAADLGLSEQVIFRGPVPRPEIPTVLGSFDVFLFTSVWEEPFGRTIIEAMAAEMAVIGSYVGGSREIMQDGENALVYAPGDAEALADRIVQLRYDPALRMRLAESGRQTVLERFTLERMLDEMQDWLEAIVAGGKV